MNGIRNPLQTLLAVLLSGVLFSVATIYNRYPFVWPDTECYVRISNLIFRTPFYSLLLYPIHLKWSLWPVVLFQSLIVAWLLHLILRTTFRSGGPLRLLGTAFILTMTTSLPWVTGLILPDIFTAVLALAFFLVGFQAEMHSGIERAGLYSLIAVSITVHLSNAPLATALFLIVVASNIILKNSIRTQFAEWWLISLSVLLGLGLLVGNNVLHHNTVQLSPGGYCFYLARLVTDGPAVAYLKDTCPRKKYALCKYLHELPPDHSDKFLWSRESPFAKIGGFYGYWREARDIVLGTVRHYPGWVFSNALNNFFFQITMFSTGSGFRSFIGEEYPTESIRKHFPREYHLFYVHSRQNRGELDIQKVNQIHRLVVFLGAASAVFGIWFYAKSMKRMPLLFLVFIVLAMMINCLVTGAASTPDNRYFSRLVWLIPFFSVSAVWDFFASRPRRAR